MSKYVSCCFQLLCNSRLYTEDWIQSLELTSLEYTIHKQMNSILSEDDVFKNDIWEWEIYSRNEEWMYTHYNTNIRKMITTKSLHARYLSTDGWCISDDLLCVDIYKSLKNKDVKELKYRKRGMVRYNVRFVIFRA